MECTSSLIKSLYKVWVTFESNDKSLLTKTILRTLYTRSILLLTCLRIVYDLFFYIATIVNYFTINNTISNKLN